MILQIYTIIHTLISLIAIFLIPVTFYVIERFFAGHEQKAEAPSPLKATP